MCVCGVCVWCVACVCVCSVCVGLVASLSPTDIVRNKRRREKKLADGFQFVDNFLLLYASVLKPYRDLSLGQVGLG